MKGVAMKRMFLCVVGIFLFLSATSCTRTSDFTLLSTKNVFLGLDSDQSKGIYEGYDTRSIIFFIPTGIPDMKSAADQAMEKGNGNLLMNAVIYQTSWYIPLIYGEFGYKVKGEVYKVTESQK
jgi:hypothetical protein